MITTEASLRYQGHIWNYSGTFSGLEHGKLSPGFD